MIGRGDLVTPNPKLKLLDQVQGGDAAGTMIYKHVFRQADSRTKSPLECLSRFFRRAASTRIRRIASAAAANQRGKSIALPLRVRCDWGWLGPSTPKHSQVIVRESAGWRRMDSWQGQDQLPQAMKILTLTLL